MTTPFDKPLVPKNPADHLPASVIALAEAAERLEKATAILKKVAQTRLHARDCVSGGHYAWDPIRDACSCYVVPTMLFLGMPRIETGDA